MKRAAICTIGDEILIGQIVDTNSAMLSKELNSIGVQVGRIISCSDSYSDIQKTLRSLLKEFDIVITTGGLGPTKDDITKKALSALFKSKKMVCNRAQMQINKRILSARGIQMLDLNLQQAYVPDNCVVIPNKLGTAPIMQFSYSNEKLLFAMPGVPFETKGALPEVISSIKEHYKLDNIFHKTICTFGIPESVLAKQIEEWENTLPANLHLAYLPNPVLGVRLRLSIYGTDKKEGERLLAKYSASLKKILGDAIYGSGTDSPQIVIGRLLLKKGATLSCAESCTGGYVAHLITSIPGSSRYFSGGVVSYSNEVKIRSLRVDKRVIAKYGAVSSQCVEQMAKGAREALKTTYSIATSGIAGPDGGTADKPVGTVWIAACGPKGTQTTKMVSSSSRQINIERSAAAAIDFLRRCIEKELV